MIVSISDQVYIFFCTILCGMAISFLYDIFRIIRKTLKSGRASIYVEDLLFWILSAVIMSVSIYYCNSGELRFYMFLGALLGAVFYELLFSRIIMNASLFIINFLFKVFKTIVFVISYPVRLICRVLAVPMRKLGGRVKATIKRVRERRRAKAISRAKSREKARADKRSKAASRAKVNRKARTNKSNKTIGKIKSSDSSEAINNVKVKKKKRKS